jgi:hypothetical protein
MDPKERLKRQQEQEQRRIQEILEMERVKKRKEEEKKRIGKLKFTKERTPSSSEEDQSLQNLPSSERQRHMKPTKFIQKAQDLVFSQIVSNSNFAKEPVKDLPPKDNKSILKSKNKKPYEEEKRPRDYEPKSDAQKMYGKPKVVKNEISFDTDKSKKRAPKKRSLPSEYNSEEYEIVYESEESEEESIQPEDDNLFQKKPVNKFEF